MEHEQIIPMLAGGPLSQPLDDEYFKNKFNTELSPQEEVQFQGWVKKSGKGDDLIDYDLRGAYKNKEHEGNGHGSDAYKKPNHPTFSNESRYHGSPAPWGKYEGGYWSKEGKKDVYTPSSTMLRHTHSLDQLMNYMKEVEPDTKLNMNNRKK